MSRTATSNERAGALRQLCVIARAPVSIRTGECYARLVAEQRWADIPTAARDALLAQYAHVKALLAVAHPVGRPRALARLRAWQVDCSVPRR